MQDVAAEAGVSKGLLHYYAASREDLLAEAYEYSEERARKRAHAESIAARTGAERLRLLLRLYFEDDPEVQEDWALWSQFSSSAVFDQQLRLRMERSFSSWYDWIEGLVRTGIEDGSIVARRSPEAVALTLTALVDGLGLQRLRGLITGEQARSALDAGLADLGSPDLGAATATGGTAGDALRDLQAIVGLARQALLGLGDLAHSEEESKAVAAVCGIVDRARQGASGALPAETRDGHRGASDIAPRRHATNAHDGGRDRVRH